MKRREFLIRSAAFLAGSMLGSKILADPLRNRPSILPVFQTSKPVPPSDKPKIALIIDDIGESLSRAEQFLEIGMPLTFAILPQLHKSEESAFKIHESGHEILLHQPMEPYGPGIDPGPGALYVGDEPEKIARIVALNLKQIPFVSGVNNHMGSRFTEYAQEMLTALSVVKEHELFFIDSLTSGHSKGYRTARHLHIPSAYRHIFLDNVQQESAVLAQLHLLQKRALRRGQAIGIGHPFPETARAIKHFLKPLRDSDIALVYSSDLVAESA